MNSFRSRLRRGLGIIAGRSNASVVGFDIRANDTFLVSFPKSGNTWARFLISNAVAKPTDVVDFGTIERLCPDIHKSSIREIARVRSPRYIKSHSAFDPRYPKVIYFVRDPRDVMVSYYYFEKKVGYLGKEVCLDEYCDMFLSRSCPYGSWAQNVSSWTSAMKFSDNFKLIRYEDLRASPHRTVEEMLDFLGQEYDDARVHRVIEMSDFKRMRTLESSQSAVWKTTKNSDSSIPFVRSARVGGWKTSLSKEAQEKIGAEWCSVMKPLGYI